MFFDWGKYKRIFAFGCSFTNYAYPTWADIIANEAGCKFYNFGKPGMGNLAISSRIAEANKRFTFTDTDLIMVMYSTAFREDRWINGFWETHGNIFNYHHEHAFYSGDFVKKYVDPAGCIIRDLSMIELSTQYIKSMPCDTLILKSAPLEVEADYMLDDHPLKSIARMAFSLYSELWESMPPSLQETMFPDGWKIGTEMINEDGKVFADHHPTTIDYYNYLIKLGINLSDKSARYVENAEQILKETTHKVDLGYKFPEIQRYAVMF